MFGIVFAFKYLTAHSPHAGATYAWVRQGLHPALGYLAGWSLVTASLIFMVDATLPVGSSLIGLFSQTLSNKTSLVTLVGAVFFLLIVFIVAFGVTLTARAQMIMSFTETGILILFIALAFFHDNHHAQRFHWNWLYSPHLLHGFSGFTIAALLAAFFYWGWDVTSNLNEETQEAHKTSGKGAVNGVIGVMILYVVATIAIQMVLSQSYIGEAGTNVLGRLGQIVWPGWPGDLIVISVILSTIATLETQLIQVSRTLFAMGRDRALPPMLGTTHHKYRTPLWATAITAIIALVLFIASEFAGSLQSLVNDANAAIGIQIAFYYGLAAFAVIFIYRRQIFKNAANFFFIFLWPLIGGVFMIYVFLEIIPGVPHIVSIPSDQTLSNRATWLGLGSIVVGLIPMAIYWMKGSLYFKFPTEAERTAALLAIEENL
jgi:amino acid transporter